MNILVFPLQNTILDPSLQDLLSLCITAIKCSLALLISETITFELYTLDMYSNYYATYCTVSLHFNLG